jgi:hypothetical protein
VAGSCEHGNETSGSIKGREFFALLSVLLASPERLYSMNLDSLFVRVNETDDLVKYTSQLQEPVNTVTNCWFVFLEMRSSIYAQFCKVTHPASDTGCLRSEYLGCLWDV